MLKRELEKRKRELELLQKMAEEGFEEAPDGNLRIVTRGKSTQYYWITEKCDTIGKYIKKNDVEKACKLAQKGYCEKILRTIRTELTALDNLLKIDTTYDFLGKIFSDMNEKRKEIVNPYVLSDEEYVAKWLSEEYKGKGFPENYPEYYSKKNERVRSKSEENIANIFLEMGIPYKYECPITINGQFKAYPDFTFLVMPQRKICYLEHFGKMDDPAYLKEEFFTKMNSYPKNGLIPGVNFYMTFESKTNPLITRDVRKFIETIVYET